MGEKRRAIILSIALVLVLAGILFFLPNGNTGITSTFDLPIADTINVNENTLGKTYDLDISGDSAVRVEKGFQGNGVSIYSKQEEGQEAIQVLGDAGQKENLLIGETKKIDVDYDGNYEFVISYIGGDKVSLELINEQADTLTRVKSKLAGLTAEGYSGSDKAYFYLAFVVLIMLFIFILAYIFYLYFLPKFRVEKIKGKHSNMQLFEYMLKEFKVNVKKGDKKLAVNNYNRIKHLVGYMSHDDKLGIKEKLNEIEKIYKINLSK